MRARHLSFVLLAPLALSACGGGDNDPKAADKPPTTPAAEATTSKPPAQPRTVTALRKAAKEEFDAYSSGDYGAAYDLWTTAAKKVISRADYEKTFELCTPLAEGIPFKIKAARVAGDKGVVRAERSIALLSFHFLYEDGAWHYVPDKASLRNLKQGVRKAVAKNKSEGLCAE
ncbi:hypothetical protein [Actinomadura atramentaria]|uniref:hypothetical protein n=1 Tax=Actinomadura atramentaria TaxID=1990 RepID=UPI0003691FDB|nr:hypothetical protein [Actinomadura atramentaria]